MKKSSAGGQSKGKQPKGGAAAHKLPPPMPEGTILTDLQKTQWKLGRPVGSGGFGLIYLTNRASEGSVKENADYCMKLEPFENGPLFCELHFYQRAAQASAISEWMRSKSLKSLGVPRFIATGNHERDGKRYRFMVMQRFGTDLQKLFESNGKRFPTHTVFQIGLKILNILEYLHEKGYVHADIKAANLLTDSKEPQEVYLIDYGLAFRYAVDGAHKEYKEDPRKAHDGTVEFTSRDAHLGVSPSRRGDLEILGYCMLQWLCGELPWEKNLGNKNYVRDEKIRYMKDTTNLISACFTDKSVCPSELNTYLQLVSKMEYAQKPDYVKYRQLFTAVIHRLGHKENEKLEFTASTNSRPSTANSDGKARAGQKRQLLASPVTSPGSSRSPAAKSCRAAAAVSSPRVRATSFDSSDIENEDTASDDQDVKPSRVSTVQQRRWPKAKVTSSALAAADTMSPLAIAKAKRNQQQKETSATVPAAAATSSSLSPLHIARAKQQQPVVVDNYNQSNGARATPKKTSAKTKTVVRHKKDVERVTQSTQVTPGLKENGRSARANARDARQ